MIMINDHNKQRAIFTDSIAIQLWLITSEEIHNSDGRENNMIAFVNAPFELGNLFSDRRERGKGRQGDIHR